MKVGERDISVIAAVAGFLGVFAVTLAVGIGIPASDASFRDGATRDFSAEAVRGKAIYQSEGCWYCHTQSVRPVGADVGLGPATGPATVGAGDARLGLGRVGPDLTCAADRLGTAEEIVAHLTDPRAAVPNSIMPSYKGFTDAQLSDLAAYLLALAC